MVQKPLAAVGLNSYLSLVNHVTLDPTKDPEVKKYFSIWLSSMTESPSSFPAPIVCCGTGSGANFVFDASLFCRGITDYILDSIEVTLLKFQATILDFLMPINCNQMLA